MSLDQDIAARAAEQARLLMFRRQRRNVYASCSPVDDCITEADDLDYQIACSEDLIATLSDHILDQWTKVPT